MQNLFRPVPKFICFVISFTLRAGVTSLNVCKLYYDDDETLGGVAQSVTCLATDGSLTADPGVSSSILAWSRTLVEIDHEISSTVILLSSVESFKKGFVSYK